MKTVKIAIISLPPTNTPVQGVFNNLNGYWVCPYILEQWAGACKTSYVYELSWEPLQEAILKSYNDCMDQFYRDNAL